MENTKTAKKAKNAVEQATEKEFTEEELELIDQGKIPTGIFIYLFPCPHCGAVNTVDAGLVDDETTFSCHACDGCVDDPDLETLDILVEQAEEIR